MAESKDGYGKVRLDQHAGGRRTTQSSEQRHTEIRQLPSGDNPVETLHCTVRARIPVTK